MSCGDDGPCWFLTFSTYSCCNALLDPRLLGPRTGALLSSRRDNYPRIKPIINRPADVNVLLPFPLDQAYFRSTHIRFECCLPGHYCPNCPCLSIILHRRCSYSIFVGSHAVSTRRVTPARWSWHIRCRGVRMGNSLPRFVCITTIAILLYRRYGGAAKIQVRPDCISW